MENLYEEVEFDPKQWQDKYIETHRVKDVDQKWKRVHIYEHPTQANIKDGFLRIIMCFVDNDDIEGIGEHTYTMSDKSVLYDPDGDHILSSVVLASRKKKKKKFSNSIGKKRKAETATYSDSNNSKKKKKGKKKKTLKKKKAPSLLKAFKSALSDDENIILNLEKVADNLQSQVNNLRGRIKKYRKERTDTFVSIFQSIEERLNGMSKYLDDEEEEKED